MWNENIEFEVTLARPKAGVRFEENNEYIEDLIAAVEEVNQEWNGDREFEILEYNGIAVKMAYHALDPIRGGRTLTRYLQKVSKILAYEKGWNEKVTRKEGTIFTVSSTDRDDDEYFEKHKGHSRKHGKHHHDMEEDGDYQGHRKSHGSHKGKEGHEGKGHYLNVLSEILEVLKEIRDEMKKNKETN